MSSCLGCCFAFFCSLMLYYYLNGTQTFTSIPMPPLSIFARAAVEPLTLDRHQKHPLYVRMGLEGGKIWAGFATLSCTYGFTLERRSSHQYPTFA